MGFEIPHIFCEKSELSYPMEKLIQNDIEDRYTVALNPQNTIIFGNQITFHIEGSSDFVDLNATELMLSVRIIDADGNPMLPEDLCSPINNILHSMISQVDVSLKGTNVSASHNNYHYLAYLYNLLNYGPDSKRTHLMNQGFVMDQAGRFDQRDNTAFIIRQKIFQDGNVMHFNGPLYSDINQQPLLIPSNLDIRYTLTPSRQQLVLQNFSEKKFKIEIITAQLLITMVKLFPERLAIFEKNISGSPIRIPITQSRVTSFTIPRGLTSYSQNGIFSGLLPKKIIFGFVSNASYTGEYTKNPFHFKHYNLNYVQLKRGSKLYPTTPLLLDFANNNFNRAYDSTFNITGQKFADWSHGLTKNDYKNGSSIFAFSLTDADCSHHESLVYGSLDLNLRFAEALNETVSLIVYSEIPANIIIDQFRNCLIDA